MSAIEINERIQLSIYGLCMASSALDSVDDSNSAELLRYRDEVTRLMHQGCRMAEQHRDETSIKLVK
jgi:hypothetical protein